MEGILNNDRDNEQAVWKSESASLHLGRDCILQVPAFIKTELHARNCGNAPLIPEEMYILLTYLRNCDI